MDDYAGDSSTTGRLAGAGGFLTGNIDDVGDSDWFALQLTQGQAYRLYVQGAQLNIGSTAGGSLANPSLQVSDPTGRSIPVTANGLGVNELVDITAATTGAYFAAVGSQIPGGIGSYTVSLRPYASEADFARYLTTGFWAYEATTPNHLSDPDGLRRFDHDVVTVNLSALGAGERTLALMALDAFHQVSRLSFQVVAGAADITYTNDGVRHAEGGSRPTDIAAGVIRKAFVQISSDQVGQTSFEFAGLSTYLHETAHALGLGHSGPYNGGDVRLGIDNLFANDTRQYTLMSYFGFPGQPLSDKIVTPQMFDIRAIQDLYGANTETRSGDTTYGFNCTAGAQFNFANYAGGVVFTIYDAAGVDTLDASGYSQAQTLDLRAGAFSSVGGFANSIGISSSTVIEVGIAGAGDDHLVAGAAGSQLYGRLGNDTISAETGSNYLRGDEGSDSISGGSGFDDANGNMGNDTVATGAGEDYCVGGKDNDSLSGGADYDLVYGNLGSDTCDGGDGNDIVRGGQDNDVVIGGAGDDFVSGDKGDDTMTGGAGADIFHTFGDAGLDRVTDFSLAQGDRVQLDPGTQFTVAQVGADTVINMVGGGQMILVGVQMSTLTPGWIFGA